MTSLPVCQVRGHGWQTCLALEIITVLEVTNSLRHVCQFATGFGAHDDGAVAAGRLCDFVDAGKRTLILSLEKTSTIRSRLLFDLLRDFFHEVGQKESSTGVEVAV